MSPEDEDSVGRLLFICLDYSSFVVQDLEILEEAYEVRTFRFRVESASTKLGRIRQFITTSVRQMLWLFRELPRADVIFGWFVDYHMVLPILLGRAFRRPSAVVVGGMDANTLPDLDYGVFQSAWRAPLARFVMRHATALLPVTERMIYGRTNFASWPDYRANGLKAHLPSLTTPWRVVPNGVDPREWTLGPGDRSTVVICVALLDSMRSVLIKGIDLLLESARLMPDVAFNIVGVAPVFEEQFRTELDVPNNVSVAPPVARAELEALYQRASVYAQLSRTESFGMAVAESMLCGVVPVVSAEGGLPELVGDCGFVVERPDPDEIANRLRDALESSPEDRVRARQWIERQFSLAARKHALREAVDQIAQRTAGADQPMSSFTKIED